MNSSKKQRVSTPSVTDNEVQANINVDEEQVSKSLKIKTLNHDCLAQILMHLSVLDRLEMEKVCQKWQEAAKMSFYNIKKINVNDLKIPLDKKEESWNKILKNYGRYLKDLTISYEYSWIRSVIIQKGLRNITRFDVDVSVVNRSSSYHHGHQYHFESLIDLVRTMTKLKYLKLAIKTMDCRNFFTGLVDLLPDDIEEIHLTEVEHNRFYVMNWKPTIHVLRDTFKSLRRLTLQGFQLNQTVMDLLFLNDKTLVHLDLSRCDSSPDESVFSRLCNLEYLNLSRNGNLNANVITTIAHNCQKLNHFEYGTEKYGDDYDDYDDNYFGELEEMDIVPHDVFSELKHLKNLEYLSLQRVDLEIFEDPDDSLISCIAENCKKLKQFHVKFVNGLATTDIEEITKFKNLESFRFNGAEIDSELLIQFANNCLELKDLKRSLTDFTATALGQLTNLKKLEKLRFYKCESLTGDLLIDIVNNCKNLIHLDLRSCNNVTEASLMQLGNLQHLKVLTIDFIKNVPNAMFDNLYKLEDLSCKNCPSVTDEGIMKVLDNCQNLKRLNIYNTGVSVESLIYADRRQFIFKILQINVDDAVEKDYYSQCDFDAMYLDFDFE